VQWRAVADQIRPKVPELATIMTAMNLQNCKHDGFLRNTADHSSGSDPRRRQSWVAIGEILRLPCVSNSMSRPATRWRWRQRDGK
jgi:hypothetical protein